MKSLGTLVETLRWYVLCALCCTTSLWAQEYPSRPVRIIVPATAGTTTDIVVRPIATKLTERLKWTVLVENRPGGNFMIGSRAVASSSPDGYTLLAAVGTLAVLQAADQKVDFLKELAFVTRTVNLQFIVIAHPSVPPNTVLELMNYAKTQPGKLSYASAGTGSWTKLAFEYLKQTTGADITEIPYKDGGFTPDVASGLVPVGINTVTGVLSFVTSGRVKALGIVGLKRSPLLPNVPTIGETGLPDFDGDTWQGLMVRAGTPSDIISRLNREVVSVLQLADVREQFEKMGATVAGDSPEDFKKKFDADVSRWARVIKAANIKFD